MPARSVKKEKTPAVEKAKISDAPQIHKLANHFAQKGVMLPRALSEIYENIRDFFVIRDGEKVIACVALHVYWSDLAEVRGLAVAEDAGCLAHQPLFCLGTLRDVSRHHLFQCSHSRPYDRG